MSYVVVRHNIEVAHRLYELPGKCENIHGHSMWVELKLHGHINKHGILESLDFGSIKKKFREYLDGTYDHHLLLNVDDPWSQPIETVQAYQDATGAVSLPGLVTMPSDPTTENLAKWIAQWATNEFGLNADCHVQETHVNGAGASASALRR